MKSFTLFTAIILLLISCSKKNNPKSGDKVITRFIFSKANNPSLTEDVEGVIIGNEIKVILHGIAKTSLKPTITYTSKSINFNEEVRDFTNPVIYTLIAEDGSTANYTVKVESRDVYISGNISKDEIYNPVYWKNGNKEILPVGSGTTHTDVSGIVVNGNDIYVAGTITRDGSYKAVYWKNGVLVELASDASVLDIKLYNGNVYILGKTSTNNTIEYVYWKNGVKTIMANNSMADTYISFIYINGNDVYTGGYTIENHIDKAAYWKNGNKVLLSNESSYIKSLMMVNNDLYAFGYQQSAAYWKNGTKNTYQFSNDDSIIDGTIIGNDIYMFGNRYDMIKNKDIAAYWKNGVRTYLSDDLKNTGALCFTTVENDIYIAGWERSGTNIVSALYWINGKKFILNNQEDCNVSSIFVKSN